MALRRACSYQATFTTPEAPSAYSAILVTIQQKGVNIINKNKSDLTLDSTSVTMKLTQQETAMLTAGIPALIQIRCYASTYDAPGSALFTVDVQPALNDQILS